MTFADFHFIRPEWLWALLPSLGMIWLLIRQSRLGAANGWAKLVDQHLLQHLAVKGSSNARSRILPVIGAGVVAVTIIGLAGPTWQKNDVPSFEGGEPTVIVLSLAQTMNADDLTPTRLKRSIHKLRDILDRTHGDERGLVIYSDTPFVASPLTSDPKVIEEMLPELSTNLMPVLGNRLDLAISEAQHMLERSDAVRGQIIILADDGGNDPDASREAAEAAYRAGYSVSVLGAGSEEGATLRTADGRAITAQSGQTFVTTLEKEELEQIATAGGGQFSMITAGEADLDRLLTASSSAMSSAGDRQDFQADDWRDMGYWLLLLPVFFAPFLFRRGLVFVLAVMATSAVFQPRAALAGPWDDLWSTPDQQGLRAFNEGRFDEAKSLFDNADWQASAAYRAGDFASATQGFQVSPFNQGNALAKSGDLEGALAAYDTALAANPDDDDAKFNRDLIERLLEQQDSEEAPQDQATDQQQDQQDASQPQDQQGGQQPQNQQGDEQSQGPQDGEQPQDQQSSSQSEEQQGGEQSEEQQGSEQAQDQQSGEASQQQNGAEGPQDQSSEQQSQSPQAGAEAERQQDGEPSEDLQDGETTQDQQTDAQAQSQEDDQEQSDATERQDRTSQDAASTETGQQGDEGGLSQLLSDILGDAPDQQPQETVESSAPAAQPIDQALEQQLRRVPDDPSGLLRARIRQHYARRQTGN
ncbi:VWA domain-containing protein [Halovulum sp. GXIMD14793]